VEPIGLLYYGSAWHLIGWCQLRKDYRDFRLSRMLSVTLDEKTFDPGAHPSIQQYIEQIRATSDLQEAVVRISKETAKYLAEQKYLNGFVSEEDVGACLRMKFLTSSISYFARWLLMYADAVIVEEPAALKEQIRELSKKLAAHHTSY
jgi:predicted DNA-binding transcriptional regulator YafY